jgi:hypothetical protein
MGFLDKLKPQPRWKHADPAIRLEALKELDDPVELAVLAESDPDVKVRRCAIGRVVDTDVLGRIVANDPDADARERAADRLVGFACRTIALAEPPAESDTPAPDADALALAAVRELTDPRRLSTIARSDAPDAVRADALARITDDRGLLSIARQAKQPSTALAALARLTQPGDVLEVALHADAKDVALAAFDRLIDAGADLGVLRTLEAKSSEKAVSRKARTVIQEREAAEAARQAALEERRRREAMLCDRLEQVAALTDLSAARAELAQVTEAWAALSDVDADASSRFTAAQTTAEQAIARRQREADEAADLRRQRAEAIATRDALCARVETLDGDDALDQLVPIEEEWRSLLPLVGNGPEADRLAERFAQAVTACRKRHEMGAVLAETRAKLDALVVESESLLSNDDQGAAAARWQALSQEARGLTAILSGAARPAADLESRLDVVAAGFAARVAERQRAAEAALDAARQDVVSRLRRLTDRARRAAEADTITLREGDRLMRDISTGLDGAGAVSANREIEEAIAQLRDLQQQVAPRVRELREMDEWRRFANAQRQEQLIAMAEAIVASLTADEQAGKESDLAATARALRELHSQWQTVAEAPRQTAQRLWDRFRTATDFIRARCAPYFAKAREEREATLQTKTAIVEEAETLAQSTDWAKAAARLQELQTAWQQTGPVNRETGRELAQRFRTACNAFFARRREDMADRKKVWSENLAQKEALCERAEALAHSTDWDATAAELKRLQAAWKTIGPVRRNKSEVVWNRFRAATDTFFDRYHHRHEITLLTKLAEREALVIQLEELAGADPAALPEDFGARVQQLRTTWNRSVPIPAAGMKPLDDRWHVALARIVAIHPEGFAGTDLDPANVIRRMQKLVARVESLAEETPQQADGALSATELLAAKLRSAFATNAMGGRASEEAKARSAAEAVREAEAAWQRLAPVSTPEARDLETRFREACRRVTDRTRRQPRGNGSSNHAPQQRPERPELATV